MDIFFSVIIPTYNRKDLLLKAIESVLTQTFYNFELIIIDDGSTDGTELIDFEFLSHKYGKHIIRYLKIHSRGVSFARNLGIQLAKGRWCAFLDSDDLWVKTKLQEQFSFIQSHPEIKIVHCDEIWIRNGVRVNQMKKHQKFGGEIFIPCLKLCLMSPSAIVIQKDILQKQGNFKEDFIVCEDYDLWLRLTLLYSVGFISRPLVIKHGGHDDQLSRAYHSMDYFRVKSLYALWTTQRSQMNEEQKKQLIIILKSKCDILIKGQIKHNNLNTFDEIKTIQQSLEALPEV